MRKLTLLFVPLLYAMIAKAQVNQDSVVIKYKDKQRVIKSVENSKKSGTTVILEDTLTKQKVAITVEFSDKENTENEDDKDSIEYKLSKMLKNLPYNKEKKYKKVEVNLFKDISFGFLGSNPTSSTTVSGLDLSPKLGKSYNFSINWATLDFNLFKNRFSIGTGFGSNHFNINYSNKQSIKYIGSSNYISEYNDSNVQYKTNRQNIRYFTIPLVLKYRNKKESFEINAGIEYNFNPRTRIVQKGTNREGDFKNKIANYIGVNEELITGILRVDFSGVALFGRVALTELYQSKYLNSNTSNQQLYSFGICFM